MIGVKFEWWFKCFDESLVNGPSFDHPCDGLLSSQTSMNIDFPAFGEEPLTLAVGAAITILQARRPLVARFNSPMRNRGTHAYGRIFGLNAADISRVDETNVLPVFAFKTEPWSTA
jgi:hypothetical protein